MKFLTLAVAIALLGIFGCDEPNQMMQQVTRETGEISEAPPTTGNIWLSETDCFEANPWYCHAGVSYTDIPGDDNTGQLTIYFEIPETIRGNAYEVILRYDPDRLETDIQRVQTIAITEGEHVVRKDTTATFILKRGETIRFNYEVLDGFAVIEIWDNFYLYNHDNRYDIPAWVPAPAIAIDDDSLGSNGEAIYVGPIEFKRETQAEEPADEQEPETQAEEPADDGTR